MESLEGFEFTETAPAKADVTIDRSILAKLDLLARIARGLHFPEYFGENWDALIDCLSGLSRLHAGEVVIDHASLPQLSAKDLRLYLESLAAAAIRKTSDNRPRLPFLFRL